MNVTFRLAGIDGEATEDRVESLNEGDEDEGNPQQIQKKYAITKALVKEFESKGAKTNGIQVLLKSIESINNLQQQRYFGEWLFKLISFGIRIKENRVELLKNKQTISILANKLFESVGISSQIEAGTKKTLFDQILLILESLVLELNEEEESLSEERMEID
mmetsp:Transcript_44130/g.42827  ORF Transcript_44130/g.42827 Transcript_44130/m.42827 type:complete len:162 (-) Transcript_44130:1916-2401(-)